MTPKQRKKKTEQLLVAEGIPFNPLLPCVTAESETRLRSPREVGLRVLCLFCVVGTAYGTSNDAWKGYLQHYQFWSALSPAEQRFLLEPNDTDASRFTWRSESLVPLMWALHLFDELPLPRHETDSEEIVARLPALNDPPEPFFHSLTLRPVSDILDVSDLIYRLHWATRNASSTNQPVPGQLHQGVIQQWHRAINWLTNHQNREWDEVSTDT